MIISYPTSVSGRTIVLLKTLTGSAITLLLLLICKEEPEKTKVVRFSHVTHLCSHAVLNE